MRTQTNGQTKGLPDVHGHPLQRVAENIESAVTDLALVDVEKYRTNAATAPSRTAAKRAADAIERCEASALEAEATAKHVMETAQQVHDAFLDDANRERARGRALAAAIETFDRISGHRAEVMGNLNRDTVGCSTDFLPGAEEER